MKLQCSALQGRAGGAWRGGLLAGEQRFLTPDRPPLRRPTRGQRHERSLKALQTQQLGHGGPSISRITLGEGVLVKDPGHQLFRPVSPMSLAVGGVLPAGRAPGYQNTPPQRPHEPLTDLPSCYRSFTPKGTMLFGSDVSQEDAFAQLDAAHEAGVTCFDSAEMYAVPPSAATCGASERILGAWLAQRPQARQGACVATKVSGPGAMPWLRGGPSALDPENITLAIEGSLQRLGVDCINLLQLHWPDRCVWGGGGLVWARMAK